MFPHLADASLMEQEAWMRAQGPYSTPLFSYIEDSRDKFEIFFFFTYLYATTYFGLPLVADRAVLVPFAHDEWPIHMPFWDGFFRRPTGFVFSTPEEQEFLRRRFIGMKLEGPTIGMELTHMATPKGNGSGGGMALMIRSSFTLGGSILQRDAIA